MLIVFKSPASADVIMFEKNGKEILSLLGKRPEEIRGVVTVAQLPGAIAALRSAIDADKTSRRANADAVEKSDGVRPDSAVRLFQRALPVLHLLELSLKEKVPVTWGG